MARFGPPQLVALTVVVCAAVLALAPPADPDVWWHLRTGDWILDHGRLPGTDPFSLVARGHRWVAHEWLAEVGFAGAWRWLGYRGVSLLRAAAVATLAGSLAVQAFRRTTPYRALGITVLAVVGTTGGWGERPQLASFLLLLPVSAYLRSCVHRDRPVWPLVPVAWLWANLHGLWVLGVGLTGLAAVAVLLDHGTAASRRAVRLALAAAGMATAAALTPNGPALLLAPLPVAGTSGFVSEWRPPSLRSPIGLCLFALLAVVVAGWGRGDERVPRSELLWTGVAAALGLSYARTVVVGVVLLVPIAARRSRTLGRPPSERVATGPWPLHAAFAATLGGVALAGAATVFATVPALPRHTPLAAVRAVAAQPAPQRLLNEYEMGGFAIWHARTARPAVDGRIELFSVGYLSRYLAALDLRGDWRGVLRELRPTVAWLHADTPLVHGLRRVEGWRTAYADDEWVVLVPPVSGGSP